MKVLVAIIKLFVFVVVATIHSTIGLAIWVRMIIMASISSIGRLSYIILANPSNIDFNINNTLKPIIEWWLNGWKILFDSLKDINNGGINMNKEDFWVTSGEFLKQISLTALFYLISYFIFSGMLFDVIDFTIELLKRIFNILFK